MRLYAVNFSCTNPDDMNYETLAKKARYFKQDEKGVAAMCKIMEDMRNEAALDNARETVRRMINLALFAPAPASFLWISTSNSLSVLSIAWTSKTAERPCKFLNGSRVLTDLTFISSRPKTIRSISSTPSKLSARQTDYFFPRCDESIYGRRF